MYTCRIHVHPARNELTHFCSYIVYAFSFAVACDACVNSNTEIHPMSDGGDCIHVVEDVSVSFGHIMQHPIFHF